jgi:hypothetical protein
MLWWLGVKRGGRGRSCSPVATSLYARALRKVERSFMEEWWGLYLPRSRIKGHGLEHKGEGERVLDGGAVL